MKQYDYVIAGAGASGLSLLFHLLNNKKLSSSRILLVERKPKIDNDRTWCFWEQGKGPFEEIVFRSWNKIELFSTSGKHIRRSTSPYNYKLIRGIDFYSYCTALIERSPNVEILWGNVEGMHSRKEDASLIVDGMSFRGRYLFNSLPSEKIRVGGGTYLLLQHFRGWFIKSTKDVFEPFVATLMDFRTKQTHGSTFVYVMPFSANEALVEYTIFSPALLDDNEYEGALREYCRLHLGLRPEDYEIVEKEKGCIPMTNHQFAKARGNIINIGAAGGMTKASSGYTFRFIQKDCATIVSQLAGGKFPSGEKASGKFRFYDSVLLNILSRRSLEGADIFTRLFDRNDADKVFRFLDNETGIDEDISIISKLPSLPFAKAAFNHLLKKKNLQSEKL